MSNINRRDFLSFALGTVVSFGPAHKLFGAAAGEKKRPNVIFIFGDDWGWGDFGCYGHRHIKTPNIDRLAKEGVLFTQFYVNASVCSPSRVSFMTGHFPARHGVHAHLTKRPEFNKKRGVVNYLDPKAVTVTSLFKKAGYVTAHYGKWHLGTTEDSPEPGEYGIDNYRIVTGNGPTWPKGEPGWWAKSTGIFVDKTIEFIEANREKSFYVNTWLLDTHAVLDPTEEQMQPYANFGPPQHASKKHKGALQIYYAAATNADKQIGRLLDKLDELGLSENTIIVFSTDNGPEDIHVKNSSHSGVGSAGPFRGRKRSIYEGGVRMPFIIRWPGGGVPAGKVDKTTILSGVDFLPSICKFAGVELPKGLNPDGEDMTEALLGKPKRRTKPLMWEWRYEVTGDSINKSPILAIRDGEWKLLMNPDRSRVELYNIPKDPMEVDNLVVQYPEIVKRLSERLLKWRASLPQGPVHELAGKNEYPWPKEQK
jgi:N-acetylgalactosamine-6-sulfatase